MHRAMQDIPDKVEYQQDLKKIEAIPAGGTQSADAAGPLSGAKENRDDQAEGAGKIVLAKQPMTKYLRSVAQPRRKTACRRTENLRSSVMNMVPNTTRPMMICK